MDTRITQAQTDRFVFFQAEDGIRDHCVTGVQTCALPIWSSDAQTTTRSARSPEVTKIFSPFRTYSSPSRRAVVRMAAESEPASGSVMAIEAQRPSKRSSCSSFATDAMAELP